MVVRKGQASNDEPEQMKFERPSEKEHLFQVVDVYDSSNAPGNMVLDVNTVCAKLEIVGGDEEGRTMLNQMTLDFSGKGFWATRLFLKSISLSHKGIIEIDTDNFIGKQMYATVIHNGKYANIKEYNFDKIINQSSPGTTTPEPVKKEEQEVAWDE